MPTLLLLRHGQSAWTVSGRFTGWVDVDLTPTGEARARHAGELLRDAGLVPTVMHTSLLTRSARTGDLAVRAAGSPDIPVHRTWRLNERSYGALEGRVRSDVRAEVGEQTYRRWRRSYDGAPPPSDDDAHARLLADPRYADLDFEQVPRTESLADVVARLLPHWHEVLVPQLRAGHVPLVVGHSNSLRALLSHLDRLSPTEVLGLDVPTGMPLVHELDEHLVPLVRGGRYLEPAEAARAAAEVAAQGSPVAPTAR
jgi:2,3-bisphosphoglycerate-dependent phosphoglycerate mutase